MNICVIINPHAGGLAAKLSEFIAASAKEVLNSFGINREIYITERPKEAMQITRNLSGNCDALVVIGGDGTIQEVVAGALYKKASFPVPIALIGAGSGNDWLRTFSRFKKTPQNLKKNALNIKEEIKKTVENLRDGHIMETDAARAGETAYLNIANTGLCARVVEKAISLKPIFKGAAYYASAVYCLFGHNNSVFDIEYKEAGRKEYKCAMMAICNGQFYGGGMRIAPSASIDDGLLTLMLVDEVSRPRAFTIFPEVIAQKQHRNPLFKYFHTKEVILRLKEPRILVLDGNLINVQDEIKFCVLPKALKLVL